MRLFLASMSVPFIRASEGIYNPRTMSNILLVQLELMSSYNFQMFQHLNSRGAESPVYTGERLRLLSLLLLSFHAYCRTTTFEVIQVKDEIENYPVHSSKARRIYEALLTFKNQEKNICNSLIFCPISKATDSITN